MPENDPIGRAAGEDVTLDHLQDQLDWYSRKSQSNQRAYKVLKMCTVVGAACIPVLTQIPKAVNVVAVIGIGIAIIEGLQQLNQYHSNWISYRSTSEALKHEKFLYLAKAGIYAAAESSHTLLAERIEGLVTQEREKWASSQEQAKGRPGGSRPAGA